MAAEYQEPDRRVVDYQPYCLDQSVIDPSRKVPLRIRGPKPTKLKKHGYFVCIGAAQTFGRFCAQPFPSLLAARLNLPVLNISHGGAGPSFFDTSNPRLLAYLNDARFVVLQVMSGRSESNSHFESDGVGFYRRRSDGQFVGCDQAFSDLLRTESKSTVMRVVEETRQSWIESYRRLTAPIEAPTILFWFATRHPDYTPSLKNASALFGGFPQLVDGRMIAAVRTQCDDYAECVSSRGLPQILTDRFTGERTTITDEWTSKPWTENSYYPSPEMHVDAADALDPVCRRVSAHEHSAVASEGPPATLTP
jgi:hypothetical protein